MEHVNQADKEIYEAIQAEKKRQQEKIELIASENFVSEAVMEAMGSVLTNKYAEGYTGKRYYGGCEHVDVAENLARDRAKQLFGAEHVNVPPDSEVQAIKTVYFVLLEQVDTVIGMKLSEGGHLIQGSSVNFSGEMYNFVEYLVDRETEQLEYNVDLEKDKEEQTTYIVTS